jgi:TolA-binding protein
METSWRRVNAAALRTLRTYPTRFPRGQLQGEARYLTFEALRRSGATAEARALGERMLRDDPNGPYARRIRNAGAVAADPY